MKVTAAGAEVRRRLSTVAERHMADVLANWSDVDRGRLASLLPRLVEGLRQVSYRTRVAGSRRRTGPLRMMPADVGIIDLMIGFPSADPRGTYASLRALAKDAESQRMEFPAEYMFKDVPNHVENVDDPIDVTLDAMDRHGIEVGLVGLRNPATLDALERHPTRFVAGLEIDPNDVGEARPQHSGRPCRTRDRGRDHISGGLQPSGSGQRPPLLPRLPDLYRS